MDSLDDVDLEQIEALEKRYNELQSKLTATDEDFPKYKEWLDDYHKETRDWIRKMEVELSEMVQKIKGPVAKATLVLRKGKTVKSLENKVLWSKERFFEEFCLVVRGTRGWKSYRRLRRMQKFQWHAISGPNRARLEFEDFKNQLPVLVRKLLDEEDNRLKNLVDQADGLTEEEMGIVMEAAEPEEENKSNYKWKSHAQKEKEKEELKQQLDNLFDDNNNL